MNIRMAFFTLLFTCAATLPSSAFADPASYFNMTETYSPDLAAFTRWTGMMSRFAGQRQIPDSECGKQRFHPCSIRDWKDMLTSMRAQPLTRQLDLVNSWANAYPYIQDIVNWGVDNIWETPYEFMEVSGNCKDYAIAKYYSLRALGVPASRMRIVVLQDLNLGGIIHAVLGVYDKGEMLILDNQAQQVIPALRIYHYRPIYGINEEGWWAYYPK